MTRTQLGSSQIKGVNLSGTDDVTGTLPVGNGGTGQTSLTGVPLDSPKIGSGLQDSAGAWMLVYFSPGSAVNYVGMFNAATGTGPGFYVDGADADIPVAVNPKGTGRLTSGGANVLTASSTDNPVTGKTFTGLATTDGIAAVNLPNGITNGNTSRQSQATASGTAYYIAGSNLNLPASLKAGMAVGTRFRWRVAMDKTAGTSTGAFAIILYRGTNGSTSDTADVTQTIGTATAVVDNMVFDVELVVTTTGATGAYYWSIIPVNKAVTATGFGIATGTGAYFSGTVSSVAMNTASLKFGLGFKYTTGTATITIPLVRAEALNIC